MVLIKICWFFCPQFSHYPANNCAFACQLPAAKSRACFIDEGTLKTKGVFSSATVPLGSAISHFTALISYLRVVLAYVDCRLSCSGLVQCHVNLISVRSVGLSLSSGKKKAGCNRWFGVLLLPFKYLFTV